MIEVKLWQRIDNLAGAGPEEPDVARWRGRFVTTLALVGSLAAGVIGLAFAWAGDWLQAAVTPGGVLFCFGLVWAWRRYRSISLIANAFGAFASMLYFSGFVVHRELSMVAWLAVVPLLVLFLGGRRLGLLWLGIETAVMIAAVAVTRLVPTLRLPLELGFEPALVRMMALMVVVFAIGVIADLSANSVLEKLREANEEAKAAVDTKIRFLANVSHELRTPLNGVVGMAELMAQNELSPAQRERLSVVLQSGHLLRLLIDDVLDATQLEKGNLQVTDGPVLVNEVARTVMRQLQSLADAKGLTLTLKCEGDQVAVSSDALRLMQVISNLVGNALKFTTTGGVTVRTEVKREGAAARVVVEVSDTGPGISAEDLQRLFTPFLRLERDVLVPGTGLGLSIVKTLVGLLGGTVTTRSTLGEGTTFRVELVRPTASAASAPEQRAGRGSRVLLVDDNAINRRVAQGLLERLGCEVTIACDGKEAAERFTPGDFELVLMDLHMPVMDGLESARLLRARDTTVPILALTASNVREELEAAAAAGMNGHLIKPVGLEQLREALKP